MAAVEGTNSYGSSIRRVLADEKISVVEAKPPRKKARNGIGKTGQIDANVKAMSVLGEDIDAPLHPRCDGVRVVISVLLAARRRVEQQSTANRNALNAVVRQLDLGIDARKALSDKQVIDIGNWRIREHDSVEQRIARGEVIVLAKAIQSSQNRMKEIKEDLSALDEQLAPGMQNQVGMGPITVGIILAAYSHPGKVRSESVLSLSLRLQRPL